MNLSSQEPLPPLSPRLRECLFFIAWYFVNNKMYPTQKEIASGLRLTEKTKTATGYVEPLVKKGYLRKEHNVKRNLRFTTLSDLLITDNEIKQYGLKFEKELAHEKDRIVKR